MGEPSSAALDLPASRGLRRCQENKPWEYTKLARIIMLSYTSRIFLKVQLRPHPKGPLPNCMEAIVHEISRGQGRTQGSVNIQRSIHDLCGEVDNSDPISEILVAGPKSTPDGRSLSNLYETRTSVTPEQFASCAAFLPCYLSIDSFCCRPRCPSVIFLSELLFFH